MPITMPALPALAINQDQPGPLEQYARILQLKSQLQMQPLQLQQAQQQVQEGAYQLGARQATNQAYKDAVTIDENGQPKFDKDILTQHLAAAGYGSEAPKILQQMTAYEKEHADALEAQNKVQATSKDALGFAGLALQHSNYDPQLAQTFIERGLQDPTIQPQAKQQLMQFRQAIGQNPALVKQMADGFITQSPKVQQFLNEQQVAQIRASKPPEGELPLGDKVSQLNEALGQRWQVLNPGQPLPSPYTLPQNATQKDFDRVDKLMQQTEAAKGTKAQQDTASALRQQTFSLMSGKQNQARSDRSYNYSNDQLDALQTPIEGLNGRMSRLQSSLDANTPQADALVAPELLSVMAGGQGSGLRMNEAEISRIVGGRSNWEGLKAAANKWSLDPSSANSITPAQRSQIRSLVSEVQKRVSAQSALLNDARDRLNNSDDPAEHRRIVTDVRRKLSTTSQSALPQGGGRVIDKATAQQFYDAAGGDPNKARQMATQNGWTVQ